MIWRLPVAGLVAEAAIRARAAPAAKVWARASCRMVSLLSQYRAQRASRQGGRLRFAIESLFVGGEAGQAIAMCLIEDHLQPGVDAAAPVDDAGGPREVLLLSLEVPIRRRAVRDPAQVADLVRQL